MSNEPNKPNEPEDDIAAAKRVEARRCVACSSPAKQLGFCKRHWARFSPADRVAALQGDRDVLARMRAVLIDDWW